MDICKLLVESGCDLDRTANSFDPLSDFASVTPLYNLDSFGTFVDRSYFVRSMMCQKHLLTAGADPTLGKKGTLKQSMIIKALTVTSIGRHKMVNACMVQV